MTEENPSNWGEKGMKELLKESSEMLQLCYRCGYKMKGSACKLKCFNCGYALDCSDM